MSTERRLFQHLSGQPTKAQAKPSFTSQAPHLFARPTLYVPHEDYEPEDVQEIVFVERTVLLRGPASLRSVVDDAVNAMATADEHPKELAALADVVKQVLPPLTAAQIPEPDFVQYPGYNDEGDNINDGSPDGVFVCAMELSWITPSVSVSIMRGVVSLNEKSFYLKRPDAMDQFRNALLSAFNKPTP